MTRLFPLLLMSVVACSDAAKAPVGADAAPVASEPPVPITAQPDPATVPPDTPVSSTPAGRPPAAAPRPFRPSANCQMHGGGEWAAHIDAMPGPGSRPRLIVTGNIAVKPAARAELRLDPAVLESYPPQRIVHLQISLPTEPTHDSLERREVRGEWPVTPPLGAVHIRCGSRSVASVSDIVVAH